MEQQAPKIRPIAVVPSWCISSFHIYSAYMSAPMPVGLVDIPFELHWYALIFNNETTYTG